MIFKKKEFFLLIFLIFLQSCSGGPIGNFLESSFNDLEKTSQDEDSQNSLEKTSQDEDSQNNSEKTTLDEDSQNSSEKTTLDEDSQNSSEKTSQDEDSQNNSENKEIISKENKKYTNLEEAEKLNNNEIKNYPKNRKIELQSYKIIFILKDVDPKDPIEELSTILRNSDVNFEIEKIERFIDLKNKIIKSN